MKKWFNNMKKIAIKLIILFIIILLFFRIVTFARYYENIGNIKIVGNIAEPIIRIENDSSIILNNMNSQTGNKEYYFAIKNYYIDEKNNKRINEINFDFNIEIIVTDKNFPIEYKIYDCETEKEINSQEKINMPQNVEFENKYKLVIFWKEKSIMSKNADIEININGKYSRTKIKAFSLARDNEKITYIISKSNNEYTNQDILLTIELNKKMKEVEGFKN